MDCWPQFRKKNGNGGVSRLVFEFGLGDHCGMSDAHPTAPDPSSSFKSSSSPNCRKGRRPNRLRPPLAAGGAPCRHAVPGHPTSPAHIRVFLRQSCTIAVLPPLCGAAVIQATDLALRVCACCHYTTEPPYHYGLYVEVQAEYLYSLAYRHVLPVRRTS